MTARIDTESFEGLLTRVSMEPNTGCWLWFGQTSGAGLWAYPTLPRNGKYTKVSHISWSLANGHREVPRGMYICHRCDTPACINPDHLYLGTPANNSTDAVVRGRLKGAQRRGSKALVDVALASPEAKRCLRGHPMVGSNVLLRGKKRNGCRLCMNARSLEHYYTHKRKREFHGL